MAKAFLLIIFGVFSALPGRAESPSFAFPAEYKKGVQYAKIERGGITEYLYTTKANIKTIQSGEQLPEGSSIVMEDFREGSLHRYVVMKKNAKKAKQYPESERNGDWVYMVFDKNKTAQKAFDASSCLSCHKPLSNQQYLQSYEYLKNFSFTEK